MNLPCDSCKGECCSVFTPFEDKDIRNIKKHYPSLFKKIKVEKIKDLPASFLKIKGKGNQDSMCSFYNNGCKIYEIRPDACKKFGVVPEMICPHEIK